MACGAIDAWLDFSENPAMWPFRVLCELPQEFCWEYEAIVQSLSLTVNAKWGEGRMSWIP
jgi:hypothetical protein